MIQFVYSYFYFNIYFHLLYMYKYFVFTFLYMNKIPLTKICKYNDNESYHTGINLLRKYI